MSCTPVHNWTMLQAPESRGVLSFVYVETDVVTHAHHCWYFLILTLHQAITVPQHTFCCIFFSSQRTFNHTQWLVMSFVLLVNKRERVENWSVRVSSPVMTEEDLFDHIFNHVSQEALNACFAQTQSSRVPAIQRLV